MKVAIVGCGLIGSKRAAALPSGDRLVACYDVDAHATQKLAAGHEAVVCASMDELLTTEPDVVVVATIHGQLTGLAERALEAGAHVLVEKPSRR